MPRTRELALGHDEGDGEEVVEHRHGVGHVHHLVVLDDLRHEVARVQVLGFDGVLWCGVWGWDGWSGP